MGLSPPFAIVEAVPTADGHDQTLSLRPLTAADYGRLVGWIESEDALYQWSGPAAFTWPLQLEQLLCDLRAESDSRFLFAAIDDSGELSRGRCATPPADRPGTGTGW